VSKLGKIKYFITGVLPYRGLEKKARKLENATAEALKEIPPLTGSAPLPADVNMLCGKKHLTMGIWSSYSLIRFYPGTALFVHSDGTLDEQDFALWKSLIPSATLISKKKRQRDSKDNLPENCTGIRKWYEKHLYAPKLIDFHTYGESKLIISLDSDVLTFKKPTAFEQSLNATTPNFVYHKDTNNSYTSTIQNIEKATGHQIPSNVNTGFMSSKRWTQEDILALDEIIDKLSESGIRTDHFWAEQTLYAISTALHHDSNLLPSDYDVYFGRHNESCTIRHYVGVPKVRPRFMTEGVPTLLNLLKK